MISDDTVALHMSAPWLDTVWSCGQACGKVMGSDNSFSDTKLCRRADGGSLGSRS